jgi:small subunit ribosomal protein S20
MAHTNSAKKRLRQDDKKRVYNKAVRSEIKTVSKKVEKAVEDKDKALATQYLNAAQAKLDKSQKKGVYHKNTVARKKAALAKKVMAIG